jgi:hypothetical protein
MVVMTFGDGAGNSIHFEKMPGLPPERFPL